MSTLISLFSHIYANSSSVSERVTKEPKICLSCFKIVKDTPALKRHCSEVHQQDIDGNSIPVEKFPCRLTTCRKHAKPFKRREKLAKHMSTFHRDIIEGQEVIGWILAEEGGAALTTNNTAEAGSDFGGNHWTAGVSAQARHDSAEANAGYPIMFEEPLFPLIKVKPAPVAKAYEMLSCDVSSQVLWPWKMFRAKVSDSKYIRGCQFST